MSKYVALFILVLATLAAGCSSDQNSGPTEPITTDTDLADNIDGDKCFWSRQVVPPHRRVVGKTYAEWSTEFWQWLWSIPASSNPGLDTTGEFIVGNQSGRVWFLAANFGGTDVRTATIPRGKYLFVDLGGGEGGGGRGGGRGGSLVCCGSATRKPGRCFRGRGGVR